MSYHVFFSFSVGLSAPILSPKGTLASCQAHVAAVESALGLETTQYLDNPPHWKTTTPKEGVTDETFCKVADEHNRWVRWLYEKFAEWSSATEDNPPQGRWDGPPRKEDAGTFETLTPEQAKTFWHGLQMIDVPQERWTREYYVSRMEHLYSVMRGVEDEGETFGAKPLTPKQAAAVVGIFAAYLDKFDMRLDVPNGCDHLASSYDGGYDWCEKCGPVHPDHISQCRKRGCPLRARFGELSWVLKDKKAGEYMGVEPDNWRSKLNKKVLHFEDHEEAVKRAAEIKDRELTVIPVVPARW